MLRLGDALHDFIQRVCFIILGVDPLHDVREGLSCGSDVGGELQVVGLHADHLLQTPARLLLHRRELRVQTSVFAQDLGHLIQAILCFANSGIHLLLHTGHLLMQHS